MMKKNFVIVSVLAILVSGLLTPVNALAELTETEVSESLICYACPGEPLNIDRCSGGNQMRDVIKKMLKEGRSKEDILDYFVAQFGDSILTTVPKKGFNLIAYTGPFIALLVGVPLAIILIRRWNTAGEKLASDQATSKQAATLDDKMRQQIEKELSELDEED
jgi:cytochrome c-type biogenesis protein CcmH